MEAPAAHQASKAINAWIVEHAGTKKLKILVMVNIKKNSFGNRTRSLAESCFTSDGGSISMAARAPGPAIWFFQDHKWKQRHDPSFKFQASSVRSHAPIFRKKEAISDKRQAAEGPSSKLQAPSLASSR